MHYFGSMQYPKEMQFMDAPRNQPLRRSSAPHCPTPAAVVYYTLAEGFAAACRSLRGAVPTVLRRSVRMQPLPATYISNSAYVLFSSTKKNHISMHAVYVRFFSIQIPFPGMPMNRNIA